MGAMQAGCLRSYTHQNITHHRISHATEYHTPQNTRVNMYKGLGQYLAYAECVSWHGDECWPLLLPHMPQYGQDSITPFQGCLELSY